MTKVFASIIALGVATSVAAQQQPPIRALGPTVSVSKEPLGAMVYVRHLAGGVIVNDMQNRRLLLFDSTLATFKVIADTTSATANAYSGRVGGLIAYRGDSSLFVDPQSLSMLVLDPAGKVARVMSVPRSQDAITIGNSVFGTPTFDASGRLVYRGFPRPRFEGMRGAGGAGGGDRGAGGGGGGARAFTPPEIPDSTPIQRIDLTTRAVDTVGFVKTPKIKLDVQRDDNGRVTISTMVNPLPVVDEWAVLSDGSIAMVRGRDYHVDWIRPDGSRESTAKIPFDWKRLTDEDKAAFIDSVKAARQRMAASSPQATERAAGVAAGVAGGAGGGGAAGGPPGEVRIMIGGGPPGAGGGGMGMGGREPQFVPASELPDYQPPFFAGSSRPDAEGQLWIRTIPTKAAPGGGGDVYDVIDSKGALVDRVQVPKNRTIIGFGAGGIVYLAARDGSTTKLERARVR